MTTSPPLSSGTVAFLFTDMAGSTRLWQSHWEALERAYARHDALLLEAISQQRGVVYKVLGDAFPIHLEALALVDRLGNTINARPPPRHRHLPLHRHRGEHRVLGAGNDVNRASADLEKSVETTN
jgi:class 3 adenylate cyclase